MGEHIRIEQAPAKLAVPIFLGSYYREGSYYDDGVCFAVSTDGKVWTPLERPGWSPPGCQPRNSGLLWRNPYFYIALRSDTDEHDVKIWRTSNLEDFDLLTTVTFPTLTEPGTGVFSPEFFTDTDGAVYLLVRNCERHDAPPTREWWLYGTKATASDLSTWDSPAKITGDFPDSCLDPFIVKDGADYLLWFTHYPDTNDQWVLYAKSSSPLSGYVVQKTGDWAGWGTPRQAPHLIRLSDGSWRIYMTPLSGTGGCYYSETSDADFPGAGWSALTAINSLAKTAHGTPLLIEHERALGLLFAAHVDECRLGQTAYEQSVENITAVSGFTIDTNPMRGAQIVRIVNEAETYEGDIDVPILLADVVTGDRVCVIFDVGIDGTGMIVRNATAGGTILASFSSSGVSAKYYSGTFMFDGAAWVCLHAGERPAA